MKMSLKKIVFNVSPDILKQQYIAIAVKNKLKKVDELQTPTSIVFFITNRCNEKCKHCFYWAKLNKKITELSLGQIEKIAKSLKNKYELLLTGGEPFLRQDLSEICNIFYNNNAESIKIVTNGFNVEQIFSYCKRITRNRKKFSVSISIDGPPQVHNIIRGLDNAFENAVATIKKLKEIGVELDIVTTISKHNYLHIEELINFTGPLKVNHHFSIARDSACVFNLDKHIMQDIDPQEDSCVPVTDLSKIFGKIKTLNEKLNSWLEFDRLLLEYSIYILENKEKLFPCYAGKIDAVIYPEGDVSFCEFVKPVENLASFDYNFYKLWNSDKANLFRNYITNCFCVHGCNLATSMNLDKKTMCRLLIN
jgi:MoaA/NifB/PqqE/SkfB family radical SAM enzyme